MTPMRFNSFSVEGFRSIKKLELTERELGHGPVVVLYGKNGAGKSNILAAMQVFWRLLGLAIGADAMPNGPMRFGRDGVFDLADISRDSTTRSMRFCATVVFDEPLRCGDLHVAAIEVEMGVSMAQPAEFALDMEPIRLRGGRRGTNEPVKVVFGAAGRASLEKIMGSTARDAILAWRLAMLAQCQTAFLLVPAVRDPSRAARQGGADPIEAAAVKATRAALQGDIASALHTAKNTSDLELRGRFERLKALFSGSLPGRPTLDSAQEPGGPLAVIEVHTDAKPPYAVPIDLVGTGLQQLYAILSAILLSKAPMVVIEEPEAHLHEPTTGLQLRELLRGLTVKAGDALPVVSQLFIATHSSIFDLNPSGYIEVSLDAEKGTQARWVNGLIGIDSGHLFEAGAARHALMDALRMAGDGDAVAYRRPDQTPVLRSEMVELLAKGDPIAIEYLKVVTSAAVQLVALRSSDPT